MASQSWFAFRGLGCWSEIVDVDLLTPSKPWPSQVDSARWQSCVGPPATFDSDRIPPATGLPGRAPWSISVNDCYQAGYLIGMLLIPTAKPPIYRRY